jgi:hypothetical protein
MATGRRATTGLAGRIVKGVDLRWSRSSSPCEDPAKEPPAMEHKEEPVKYMLMVCTDPSDIVEETPGGLTIDEWLDEMTARKVRLDGDRLRPSTEATTVRVRGGDVLVTDGPYVETKEQMAGYDIIDAADLDEAIEIASKHPVARFGMIEVRPFWVE